MGAIKASDVEMARINFITGCILMLSSLVAIFWLIPVEIKVKAGETAAGLSPRFFPYIAAISMLILSTLLAVSNALKMRSPGKIAREESEENEVLGFGLKEINNCIVMAVGVALYMAGLSYIGFLVSSTVMMGVSMYIAGIRGWKLPVIAIGFPWAMKLLFWHTLEVTLP